MNEQRRQAAIEAGARALRAAAAVAVSDPSWDEIDEPWRRHYRKRAAAVIDAAAPHLVADALQHAADKPLSDPALLHAGWRVYLHELADRIERGEA